MGEILPDSTSARAAQRQSPARQIAAVFMSLPVGGAEDLALSLARELRPRGWETHFVCLREEGPLAEEIRAQGFACTLLPIAPRKRWSWWGARHLAAWFREMRIDVVHSHTYHAHTYAIPAARRCGVPAFLHHHKTLEKMKWHRRWTLSRLTAQAHRVLALSPQTARDLQELFGLRAEKVLALPNAVDTALFRSPSSEERAKLRCDLGLPMEAPLLLTVASLQQVKNHELTLRALAQLPPGTPAWEAVFVGEGPLRSDLQCLAAELALSPRVHFVGARRPIAPWFQMADAFVFPSWWEGQSLALLQALACTLPVLASRIEGNTALLGPEYPALFDPAQPEELAALLALPPEQLKLRATNFCGPELPAWEDLVRQVEMLYETAIDTANR